MVAQNQHSQKQIHKPFYALHVHDAFRAAKSSPNGLSRNEAQKRLQKYGHNELQKPARVSGLKVFFSQFTSVLIYILLAAAFVSFLLKEVVDAVIIVVAVFLNVVIGFIQEYKAQNALAKLRDIIEQFAVVIRDGKYMNVSSKEVVRGDILVLTEGDVVAADGRIIEMLNLEMNEAPLTGESMPVGKQTASLTDGVPVPERKNYVYAGTIVARGKARMLVEYTGLATEIGKISSLLANQDEENTPLQEQLEKFSKFLSAVVLVAAVCIFLIGIFSGHTVIEMFTTAVAVAVSAIPEGLVIGVTAILAVGMQRILRQKALVRRLVAAETLGSANIICVDKTGTMTKGRMGLHKIMTATHTARCGRELMELLRRHDREAHLLMRIGMLASDAHEAASEDTKKPALLGDPVDVALAQAALDANLHLNDTRKAYPAENELPFDAKLKYMATSHRTPNGAAVVYIKGAPEKLLACSTHYFSDGRVRKLLKETRKKFTKQFEDATRTGARVLAGAYRDVSLTQAIGLSPKDCEKNLIFVGYYLLLDPIREDAPDTIRRAARAGVRTIMITGDHRLTAQVVARDLGLPSNPENIIDGEELAKRTNAELKKRVRGVSVFARVTPEQKLRILNLLKTRGNVLAMTGDGVNDAPAIQAADIGIALGSGSDVSHGVADLVLLDDSLSVIVSAIEEGRVIFENIRKVVLYLLSDSFSELILIGLSLLAGVPLPLTAAQILYINLLDDGFPNIALTMEPKEKGIMREKPRGRDEAILNGEMKLLIAVVSVLTGVGVFAVFLLTAAITGDLATAQTVAFASLGMDSLLYVFSIRSLRYSIFHSNLFSNIWLVLAVTGGIFFQVAAIYFPPIARILGTVPLGAFEWMIILSNSFVVIVCIEVIKYLFIVRRRTEKVASRREL